MVPILLLQDRSSSESSLRAGITRTEKKTKTLINAVGFPAVLLIGQVISFL